VVGEADGKALSKRKYDDPVARKELYRAQSHFISQLRAALFILFAAQKAS
jgi:hypothetical protein